MPDTSAAMSEAAKPEAKRILVLAPNWLGDAVMATPALRALRNKFPHAHITIAGKAAVCEILSGIPWLDAFEPLPARPSAVEMIAQGKKFRRAGIDFCVVLPHSFRAALLARCTGASRRIGYDRGGRRLLLSDAPRQAAERGRPKIIYTGNEYLNLVKSLGCSDDGRGLELHADADEVARVREICGEGRPLIGFAPGAAYGPSKRWPAERFAALANLLHESVGAQCLLLTGPGEEEQRDAFLHHAHVPVIDPQADRPSLARFKATVASLDLLVGNDSGPRHVAIAFGKPVLCIMGPTRPEYTESPWERGQVLRVDVPCGPCQRPHCVTDHRCMTLITPGMAAQAACEILQQTQIAPSAC